MAIQILCDSENESQAELDTPSNDRVRDKSYSNQRQMETRHDFVRINQSIQFLSLFLICLQIYTVICLM